MRDLRKTRQMREFEAQHGGPAEKVIKDAINEHGSIAAAARELGMSRHTLFNWVWRLRLDVGVVATSLDKAAS